MNLEQDNLIADKIAMLNKEYKSRLISTNLQLLGPHLQLLESIAVLDTVEKNSRPFAIALLLGGMGIYKSESELGLVGPALEQMILLLTDAINKTEPHLAIGNKRLFKDGCVLTLAGIIALTAHGANEGMVNAQLYTEGSQKDINGFGLELLVHIGANSEIVPYVFDTLCEICGYKKREMITDALTLISYLLAIWSVSRVNGPGLEKMIQSLTPQLQACFVKIEKSLDDAISNESIDFEQVRGLIVICNQARFALDNDDPKKLIQAINMWINTCGIDTEQLDRDLEDLCFQIKIMSDLLQERDENELNMKTGFWQAG